MPRAAFTKAEIARAVEGAKAAGLTVGMVEITRDGTIRILPATTDQANVLPKREDNTCAGKFGRRP